MGRQYQAFVACALAIASIGCPTVEPRDTEPRPYLVNDAGTGVELNCLANPGKCDSGQYCNATGQCIDLPASCETTTDCAPHGDPLVACVALNIDTSTTNFYTRCTTPPRACRMSTDCARGENCTAVGRCAPGLVFDGEQIRTTCTENADCRPTGACNNGVCAACGDSVACRDGLICSAGRCVEPSECLTDGQCYDGNKCIDRRCVRDTTGCLLDQDNDAFDRPDNLFERYTGGLTICGRDTDWYAFTLQANDGARLIVTTTRTENAIDVELRMAEGGSVQHTGTLSIPGMTVIDIPALGGRQQLRLGVSGEDSTGTYAIDLRRILTHCAGDAFDLYGDTTTATAARPILPSNGRFELRQCPGDVDLFDVPVARSNGLFATVELPPVGTQLDLQLIAPTGAVVSSTSTTDTSSRTLSVSHIVTVDEQLTIQLDNLSAPSVGTAYTLSLRTELGARRNACAIATDVATPESITLAGGDDLGAPTCGAFLEPGANDRIFTLPVITTPNTIVRATVLPTTTTDQRLAVALLTECGSDDSTVSCDGSPANGLGASLEYVVTSTPARLNVMVSANTSTAATFELFVDIVNSNDPPTDNFTCIYRSPELLQSAGEDTTVTTTIAVSNEAATDTVRLGFGGACDASLGGFGPDRFYALDLQGQETAVITLDGAEGGLLWAATGGCRDFTNTCTAAMAIADRTPAEMILAPALPANYLIAVDGIAPDDIADYTLVVRRNPECLPRRPNQPNPRPCPSHLVCDNFTCVDTPANNACPGQAITLVNGRQTLRGSTAAARPNYVQRACGFFGSGDGGRGQNDVVYALDLPEGAPALIVEVTTAQGINPRTGFVWDPILAVRHNDCSAAEAEVACNDDFPDPSTASTRLPRVELGIGPDSVAAGTYYIIVDAWDRDGAGTFELLIDTNE